MPRGGSQETLTTPPACAPSSSSTSSKESFAKYHARMSPSAPPVSTMLFSALYSSTEMPLACAPLWVAVQTTLAPSTFQARSAPSLPELKISFFAATYVSAWMPSLAAPPLTPADATGFKFSFSNFHVLRMPSSPALMTVLDEPWKHNARTQPLCASSTKVVRRKEPRCNFHTRSEPSKPPPTTVLELMSSCSAKMGSWASSNSAILMNSLSLNDQAQSPPSIPALSKVT
mmetsp:Transcript_4928/g.13984  ORF Transcript_4928/g.13984 Transcript_4928/m.13984 type:complete len:230 (-) Transcript_4928:1231-1920(-)